MKRSRVGEEQLACALRLGETAGDATLCGHGAAFRVGPYAIRR